MGSSAPAARADKTNKNAAADPDAGGIPFFKWLTDNPIFSGFVLLCIVANAAALGFDAHFGDSNPWHKYIEEADTVFLMIFTAELLLEFLAQGPKKYFRNGWNWFDVIVVGICYLATSPAISALRTLRVMRVFRLISAVPQMRHVVEALFAAMPGILATVAILAVVFFIGSVTATTLFRGSEGFNNLAESALTLFQLSQFDGWGETVNRLQSNGHTYAWAFILAFNVIAAFGVLNLFIGVIVEAVQEAPKKIEQETADQVEEVGDRVIEVQEAQDEAAITRNQILAEVRVLRDELAALKAQLPPRA